MTFRSFFKPNARDIRVFIAVIALIVAPVITNIFTPKLCQHIFVYRLATSSDLPSLLSTNSVFSTLIVDKTSLTHSVIEEVVTAIKGSPLGKQIEKSNIDIISILTAALSAPSSEVANSLQKNAALTLPLILGVHPVVFNSWIKQLTQGHFAYGDCVHRDSRAACEIKIDSPHSSEKVSVVLLWERRVLLWKLMGVSGLGQLLTKMQGEPSGS